MTKISIAAATVRNQDRTDDANVIRLHASFGRTREGGRLMVITSKRTKNGVDGELARNGRAVRPALARMFADGTTVVHAVDAPRA